MSNGRYVYGKEQLPGPIDWLADDIRALLVSTSLYAVDLANHRHLSSIPVGARVNTSPLFAGKTTTGGILGAANSMFSATSGPTVGAVVIFRDGPTDGDTVLLAYFDTGVIGIPFPPNGSLVELRFDPQGIFES